MKAVARQARPAAGISARSRRAQIGHISVAHERQADTAALGFVRGQTGLRGLLTPAPTAGFTAPDSVATPLPNAVRSELETAFGADLRAVRLHRDTASAQAAALFGARAFASGTDIFFAAGMFRPGTLAGRELLAHEVGHVLQQTARAAAGGCMAATPIFGGGLVQCAPSFESLRKIHAAKPEEAKYKSIADELQAIAGDKAAIERYVVDHRNEMAKWSDATLALAFDVAKAAGAYAAAAKLIELDDFNGGLRIATAFYAPDLEKELESRSVGTFIYERAIERFRDLKLYRSEWLRLIEMFLLQPVDRKTPPLLRNLDPDAGPASKKWQNIQDHKSQTFTFAAEELHANEWYIRGLERLAAIDERRVAGCDNARSNAQKLNAASPWIQRTTLTASLRQWAEKLVEPNLSDTHLNTQWKAFHQLLSKAVVKIIDDVEAVWLLAIDFNQLDIEIASGAADKSTDDYRKQRAAVLQLAAGSGLGAQLASVAQALNAPDRKRNRIPADYVERSRKQAAALQQTLRAKFEDNLQYWLRQRNMQKLIAAALLVRYCERLLKVLQWSWHPFVLPPEASPAVGTEVTADRVIAHRLLAARMIGELAGDLKLKDAANAAEKILSAEFEPESQLVLLPDEDGVVWHETQPTPERLMKDFSAHPFKGLEPLTAFDYVLLLQTQFLEELRTALTLALPSDAAGERRAALTGSAGKNIIATTRKTVRDSMDARGIRPERWSVAKEDGGWLGTYFAPKAGGKSFEALLSDKVVGQKFYADAYARGLRPLMPTSYHGDAFVWMWPPYPTVIELLRQVDTLDELVALQRFGKRDAESTRKVHEAPDSNAWLADLRKVLQAELSVGAKTGKHLSQSELDAYLGRVETFFRERRERVEKDLLPLFHKATRIDRQLLAARIRERLDEYAKDTLRPGIAHDQAETIQTAFSSWQLVFRKDVETTKDPESGHEKQTIAANAPSRMHLAALLLEIAPNMQNAFKHERFGTVVYEFLGLIEAGEASTAELRNLDAVGRSTYLPAEESTDAWLQERSAQLTTVAEKFRKFRESVQLDAGFVADADAGVLRTAVKLSDPVPLNEVLYPRTGYGFLGGEATGKRYRVTAIRRSFAYHPSFGEQAVQSDKFPSGYGAPMLLEPDGSRELVLKSGEKLLRVEELDKEDNVIRDFDIGNGPGDQKLMADIYSGAVYWAFASAMARVQRAIEAYVSTLVDIAELIPGWGKFITAAKIAVTIADFWSSDIYQDMLKIVNGDIKEMVSGLVDKFSEIAHPGALLELLLFGSPLMDELLSRSTNLSATKSDKFVDRRPPDAKGKFGALKKTFAAVKRLGLAFVGALSRLRQLVQQPMQDAREFVSTRPTLSFALHFAAAHVYELMELAMKSAAIMAMLGDDEKKDSGLMDDLRRTLGAEQANLGKRIHELMDRLARLELPSRLVDVTPAVQFVLDELVVYVGGRLGLEGKAVTMVLKGSGLLDLFTSRVADAIVSRGFDPNVFWRNDVIPLIADKFTETRDSLLGSMNDLLKKPAFDGMFEHIDEGPPMTLEPSQDEPYAEMQPSPAGDRRLIARPASVPAVGSGMPLTDRQRFDFEDAFGQDFSNVRIHTGSAGDAMTSAFGAEALTSGSHVFLRAGLDPRRGQGKDVMRHELAHVVQQTGRRQIGGSHPATPKPARPERGLAFDPSSESEADRMAQSVKAMMPGGSLSASATSVEGMQPYTLEDFDPYVLSRVLRAFNKLEEIKKREAEIDRDAGTRTPDRVEDTNAVDAVVAALEAIAKKSSTLKIKTPPVFSDLIEVNGQATQGVPVMDRVLGELAKNLGPEHFKKVAREIAFRAQDTLPQPRPIGKAKPSKKKESYVNPSHFAHQLEGYILGKTGIALALDLKTRDFKAPNGSTRSEIDPAGPIEAIKLLHIYLPYIAPNAELSIHAITNTWPAAKTDAKLRGQLSGVVRGHLEGIGIRATVWALFGKLYKFSVLFKRDIDKMMEAKLVHGGALDPDSLTTPTEYADGDLAGKQVSPIGTRLGTYESKNQKAGGRHSHHLTQFLVAEYFANKNDNKKPFNARRSYPGVQMKGSMVVSIAEDPARQPDGIKIGETYGSDSGRGAKMPAISLAASTHQSGDLHITPAPDDLGGGVQKTQAFSVDSTFRAALPPELRADATDAKYATYRRGKTDAAIASKIYDATQRTFQHWSEHMNKQLLANMPRLEVAYYKALAANHTREAVVKQVATSPVEQAKLLKQLEVVAHEAVEHNYSELAKYNWKK